MAHGIPREVVKIGQDIKSMKIRGAGRIARAAVRALLITSRASKATTPRGFFNELNEVSTFLLRTRPTAVSLPNGLRYVLKRVSEAEEKGLELARLKSITIKTALEFIKNSKEAIRRIGEIGAHRINDGDVILTHCNSDAALTILTTAWESGKKFKVYVTETRPRLQGLISMKILGKKGIPVTLIIDSAARYFMNDIDKVIVGADAVAANGAVINKIGTSLIALAAKEARTSFFVAAETYKFSPETVIGALVKIEERGPSEVIPPSRISNLKSVSVKNPSFDVTPAEYVDLIITEKGIIPPEAAFTIIQQEFGPITRAVSSAYLQVEE